METVERTLRAFADYPKVVELRHKSWSRIAPRRIGFSKRIERTRPLSTNRSFLFPSDKSLNQSAIYSTSERMAEMQRHGGNMRSRGNATIISTPGEIKKIAERIKPP